MIIRYVGFDKLSLPEKSDVMTLAEKYGQKLERFFPQPDAELMVQVKLYDEAGARIKYSVHTAVGIVRSARGDAVAWDLRKAVRAALMKLMPELEKKASRRKAIPPKRRS
ncbi:MAG TPA: hypothetical protein VJB87_01205 [Candidatus Nanoarchaeia archaeon]|nr:hypothetical protein [Candidatus Nanoarchaeia archaeon]